MNPVNPQDPKHDSPPTAPRRRLFRTTALAAALAIGAATFAFAVVPGARAVAAAHAGMHDQSSMFAAMHGGHSPEDMHAHFDRVLADAGAGKAQRDQVHAIMKDAMDAEHADMQRFHETCARLKAVLTAPVIDDAAVQKIRVEQDQLVVATSHRLSDTMVAVARVLTPAQRAKLGADIDRMMLEHHMQHHGG